MSSNVNSSYYFDQYFSQTEAYPTQTPNSDAVVLEDQGWGEDLFDDLDDSYGDIDFGLIEGEDLFENEEVCNYSEDQKGLIEWMKEKSPGLRESFEKAQEKLDGIENGQEGSVEERKKLLGETLALLNEIDSDLSSYYRVEKRLENLGLEEEEVFGEEAISEDFEGEVEELKGKIEEELGVAEKAEKAELAEEKEEKEKKAAKDSLIDALGYFNGTKGHYFTAKVICKKHIYDYHKDVTEYARGLFSDMAQAMESGSWETVKATCTALSSGSVDNTLGLTYVVLSKYPNVLDKIPSDVLELMSDCIQKGNNPSHRRIYYIPKGKGSPKNHRRREKMKHIDISYAEAAEKLRAQAEINKTKEAEEAEIEPESEESYLD